MLHIQKSFILYMAANEWFSHLAIEVPGKDGSNEWLEAVTDEQYDKLK